ncbi:hypothetical protein CAL20_09605 [Bordetella genomosp. 4]|uniref:Uncharacterized protein n=1 Tax=Bordetella genomosp. 4 TaxID=463044 RepID=A0A261U881_9BORD|nr:hypothetical protein CAL20_09605 [Bordetella genomosp. 4]
MGQIGIFAWAANYGRTYKPSTLARMGKVRMDAGLAESANWRHGYAASEPARRMMDLPILAAFFAGLLTGWMLWKE